MTDHPFQAIHSSSRKLCCAIIFLSAAITMMPTCLAQAPVDLNNWSAESYAAVAGFGAGNWNVTMSGDTVFQSVNGQPTLFYSDFNAFNTDITGQINVSGGDDDYIGFVLGYQPNDANNANADYLLVDWKRIDQTFNFQSPSCTPGSIAERGLAVSRVTGIPTADEFWGHLDFDEAACSPLGQGLEELQRGATLFDTGWTANQTYAFQFVFNATTLQVFVDGVLELDITGNFANGRIGFYNFSQAAVTYDAFSLTVACPNAPLRQNYGSGSAGTTGIPGLMFDADPIVGTTPNLVVGNSSGLTTFGCLIVGTAATSMFLPSLLAELVVNAFDPSSFVIDFSIPASGLAWPVAIPLDQDLCGVGVYLQFIQQDNGAALGYSFTPGLELVIGG